MSDEQAFDLAWLPEPEEGKAMEMCDVTVIGGINLTEEGVDLNMGLGFVVHAKHTHDGEPCVNHVELPAITFETDKAVAIAGMLLHSYLAMTAKFGIHNPAVREIVEGFDLMGMRKALAESNPDMFVPVDHNEEE